MALGVLAVMSPAAQKTFVSSNCTNAAFKPSRIVLACADAGFIATHLSWSSWGQNQAAATGTGSAKVCKPDCASGKVKEAPIQLRLLRPRYCSQDGKRHLTKVEYVWTHGSPAGGSKQGTVSLSCSALY